MSTPTGASGKFAPTYFDAAGILSLMATYTQPTSAGQKKKRRVAAPYSQVAPVTF